MLLGAVAQRRMVLGQLRERGDRRVERVGRVEVLDRRRRVGADQVVVVVARDLAGEHVLARVLVAAVVAGEALLVAVVDDRVAAREVHQLVREPVAGEQLGIGGPAVGLLDEVADAAHVVVAQERRQLVGVGVGVRVPVVVGEERLQLVGGARAGRELLGGRLEREVEHGLRLVRGREARRVRARGVEDLAEHEELALALPVGVAEDVGQELLPELVVDVLHRVDPEAVDREVLDPRLIDVGHPGHDARMLGEQVVEPEEVAVERVLAGERRVAAVVVERRVVEPLRHLARQARGHERGERERALGAERGEAPGARVVGVVERRAGRGAERLAVLGDVRRARALAVVDDVRGVVGDDVEEDLHPARVRGIDQLAQLGVGAEVRVDLREVRDPVAVVAGRLVLGLVGAVLEARREPDRGRAEALDVVDPLQQAGEVAAVVHALVRRVQAGDRRIGGVDPALVVVRAAVLEPVGHHEVEVLPRQRRAQAVPAAVVLPLRRRRPAGQRDDRQREQRRERAC